VQGGNHANETGTRLNVPAIAQPTFFSSIAPEILHNIEIASPSSLRRAAAALRKPAGNYTLAEGVLLNVCAEVTRLAWASSAVTWDKPEVHERNAYTGALDSVRLGIYDVSTGNTDFLTNVLPSLILVTSSQRSDYYTIAERDLKKALSFNGNSVLVHYLLGMLYRKMGRDNDALLQFQETVRLDTSCFESQLALASVLYNMERLPDAEQQVLRLIQSNPSNTDVFKLATEIAYRQQKYPLAGDYVARVLQREPENSYYVLFRARIFVVTGEYIKAASLLDAYSRTDKTSRDYLMLRAQIQTEWNKNNAAAIETLEQALQLYPNDNEIILFTAHLASATGQKVAGKSAGEFAQIILTASPGNSEALGILVSDAMTKRAWSEAYRYSLLIKQKNPSLKDQVIHAQICLLLNNRDEARTLCEQLYASHGSDTSVQEVYIKMLVATGERARAQQLINAWLSDAKPAMKSFLYWQRSLLSNASTDILNDLRLSLTADPRNADALMELYRYYYNLKDYRKAQYYLKQVVALTPNDAYVLDLKNALEKLVN
jgi:predicted Zn-dependent protease